MRVLTDPAETGAVTLSLPQDVQAEAWDWEDDLFARRVWHVSRQPVALPAVARAADAAQERPASADRRRVVGSSTPARPRRSASFAEATGVPVAESQAGKGSLRYDHPLSVGAIGATGTTAADELAAEADVVIGVGTRFSDFTTGSKTVFADPDVRFVNLNVTAFDAHKLSAVALVGDARVGLEQLTGALDGWTAPAEHSARATRLAAEWDEVVQRSHDRRHEPLPAQSEVIGVVNTLSRDQDVVVCAAGSMPGDLHKLWRTRDRKGYHVEYGFSCMGYEIAGGLGVKMAALDAGEDRDVVVMVGDGSYLMMSQEIVTAVQEGVKLIVVLVQNHGFASIGALSESLGSQRFGTRYRYRTRHRARRRRAPRRPRGQRRQPRGSRDVGAAASPSWRRPSPRPRPRTSRPSSTSRPTRSCRPPTARPGGTCRWPRSRRWSRRGRHGPPTRTRSRRQRSHLRPATNERDHR